MKLSCLPVSLYADIFSSKRSVVDWIHFAAALGLDGVDFSIKFFPTREAQVLDTIRDEAQRAGITLCMLACYSDFTYPDHEQRRQEIEQMKADVRLAATLGISFVRVTAGQNHPGIQREHGIRWVVDGMREVLEEADKLGVTLAYENHTKGAPWQYWDFSQPAEIFLDILGQLTDTSLKVCFDTANPLVLGEDVIALLEAVIDRVAVVHTFDMRTPGEFEPVVVGTGASPIKQVFSILRRNGFDGWVSIEEASRTGEAGFEKSISFVRRAWEEAG
ncbi:MAG: sugar phosphate isomerase/epimerase [Candidatus Poribacteria bacterium]|nr:sugar phosphate isomerase/epimerase [Candidatus Poribacteria bacterium]